jgi:hypothetical protein
MRAVFAVPLAALFTAVGLVACGGPSLLVPRAGVDGADGSAESHADPFATGPTMLPRPVQAVPYVDVAKVAGDCSAHGGTPHVPASSSEVVSLLVGRWRYCSGDKGTISTAVDGLELARNRRFRYLLLESGVLVPTDVVGPGLWYLAAEDPTIPNENDVGRFALLLFLPGSPSSSDMFYPVSSFLENPTRVNIFGATYVWLGE